MGDFGSSVVRTIVPIVAGAIIALLVSTGAEIDESTKAALTTSLTGIFTALWYVVFRWLELHVSPKWGWLLGLAKSASYTPTPKGE